ncbi:hypothetical protein QBC40DRAFT_324460 [Triangularia verruculosa]|uniref:Uncharacterized protein n=1 Tax=Triangularia verruculosa TaxID=2587418 RepID=A0AAN6XIL6_9PEZI|nr:hypothetical protein QBC40DRAFT_324460 [Triangularia verruculosa]
MPPKRRGTSTAKAAPAAKKSRPSTDAESAAAAEPETVETSEPTAAQQPASATTAKPKPAPKKKAAASRWTIPSCSANIANEYKRLLTDGKEDPFVFALMCDAPFSNGDSDDEWEDEDHDDEEDEEDEDEDEGDNKKDKNQEDGDKPKCDGGKKCYCTQLYDDHPEHPYVMTRAAKSMFVDLRSHCEVRDPDNFRMYTFNDHSAYGALQVLENLILDYEEADSWQERWAVCEAMGSFLKTDYVLTSIDDGFQAMAIWKLMGRLFLSQLAEFERDGLLTKDGPVKNLGFIMAVWMTIPSDMRPYGILDDSSIESLGPAKDKKKWTPHSFDEQILAYARKYDIDLKGPHNLDDVIQEVEGEGEADLPKPESNTEKADVFGYKKDLTKYKQKHGGGTSFMSTFGRGSQRAPKSVIGGDSLDITSWTSAERKKAAFNKKDPLSAKELQMIREGCVMSQG